MASYEGQVGIPSGLDTMKTLQSYKGLMLFLKPHMQTFKMPVLCFHQLVKMPQQITQQLMTNLQVRTTETVSKRLFAGLGEKSSAEAARQSCTVPSWQLPDSRARLRPPVLKHLPTKPTLCPCRLLYWSTVWSCHGLMECGSMCISFHCNDNATPRSSNKLTHSPLFSDLSLNRKVSEYPVILSVENHCGVEQQRLMAHHLNTILGDKLLKSTLDGKAPIGLPSPEVSSSSSCLLTSLSLYQKVLLKSKNVSAATSP